METSLVLTQEEISLLELAVEGHIDLLKNRFNEEEGIVHPARKYEELEKKLNNFFRPLPSSNYKINCIND